MGAGVGKVDERHFGEGRLCPEGLAKLDYEADFFVLPCSRYVKADVVE
jgi:hypothetical protein